MGLKKLSKVFGWDLVNKKCDTCNKIGIVGTHQVKCFRAGCSGKLKEIKK